MREPRSIVFYAWAALGVQLIVVAAVFAFVLVDATRRADLVWACLILAALVALPIATALALMWTVRPVHEVTSAIRRRAAGDYLARAAVGGPADIRELARSLNSMADESDRLQGAQTERVSLQAHVRDAAIRIRAHLNSRDVIREAVVTVQQMLPADGVAATLIDGREVRMAEAAPAVMADFVSRIPKFSRDTADWVRTVVRHRASYCLQDLGSAEAEEQLPGPVLAGLREVGAASMLVVPFGTSEDALGLLGLMRQSLIRPWTAAEIEAVESLAIDIGRGLEHARLYESELRLVAELESLDRAKASFLASASHDLRTPLTSILGYAELLEDGSAGPVTIDQARMLDAVTRNTRRLRNMIEDMLTISKIELGSLETELKSVNLTEVVPLAADTIRPSAIENGLSFEVSVLDAGLVVDGDAAQLDRMMMNLLSNAVKYTPRGGRVSLSAGRENGNAVLRVADTGIGIPESEQPALFTRFFRGSNAIGRAIQGSGLGLSIVRAIVSNHHGDITVNSREGVGTTVTVRLPLRSAAGGTR